MKFGIFNLMSLHDNPEGVAGVIRDTEIMVRLAEDVGFDISWFAEHHFSNYSVCVSPLLLGARLSGLTKRIKMGTAVIVLPLYHPLRVAQEVGLLDQMTDGRIAIGVGSGYQPYEFTRYGRDVAEKSDIFLEYWDILEQAWMEGHVHHEGKHIAIPETVITARPSRMPTLFTTASDPRIMQRLAVHDPIPFVTAGAAGTKKLYELHENVKKSWSAAGLDGKPMPFALQQYIHVTDSASEAIEAAERARKVARAVANLRNTALTFEGSFLKTPPLEGEPSLEVYRDNIIIGDPHHVAERMAAEIRRLNPVHYSCFFQFGDMPIARASRSLERFGHEVMPLLEAELGSLEAIGQPETLHSIAS